MSRLFWRLFCERCTPRVKIFLRRDDTYPANTQRRYNVMTLQRCCNDVVATLCVCWVNWELKWVKVYLLTFIYGKEIAGRVAGGHAVRRCFFFLLRTCSGNADVRFFFFFLFFFFIIFNNRMCLTLLVNMSRQRWCDVFMTLCTAVFFFSVNYVKNVYICICMYKEVREKSRECHNHNPQASPDTRGRGNRQIQ